MKQPTAPVRRHVSEDAARQAARAFPELELSIIESDGRFFVETEPGMIRSWERLVFQGKGGDA